MVDMSGKMILPALVLALVCTFTPVASQSRSQDEMFQEMVDSKRASHRREFDQCEAWAIKNIPHSDKATFNILMSSILKATDGRIEIKTGFSEQAFDRNLKLTVHCLFDANGRMEGKHVSHD
ncbi:MAG: hypothetical protein M3O62_18900 [Pseudomonadota bacterium]|nr:hypothetical protein [Pseudomonadota bacterium]